MAKKKLLREQPNYGEHRKYLAMLGGDKSKSSSLPALIADLQKGQWNEQIDALWICSAAQIIPPILEALKTDSVSLCCVGSSLAARLASDQEIMDVLDDLSAATSSTMLRQLKRFKRQSLADKLVPYLADRHEYKKACSILSLCSANVVEKYLPEWQFQIAQWRNFAQYCPDITLKCLRGSLAKSPEREWKNIWQRFKTGLQALCIKKPVEILELIVQYWTEETSDSPFVSLSYISWMPHFGILMRLMPDKAYLVLTTTLKKSFVEDQLPAGILRNIRYFSKEHILSLAKLAKDKPHTLASLMKSIAPSMREEVFRETFQGMDISDKIWPEALLESLPEALCAKEAARMTRLRAIETDPEKLLAIWIYCPIGQAREIFYRHAKSAQAEERGKAFSYLIRCTGKHRSGLSETLQYLQRIKNEQDPVRARVFEALASIPPSLFGEEHAEEISKLSHCVFEARDTSIQTRTALELLAKRIFQLHAKQPEGKLFQTALELLRNLAGQSGTLSFPQLRADLTKGTEDKIVQVLLPQMEAAAKREDYRLILALVLSFGKRGWYLEPLQNLLQQAVDAKPDYVSSLAINLWLQPSKTRNERVRKLLNQDLSVITLPHVFNHVHTRCQELLDPFLSGNPIGGKFSTGRTVYLLPAESGFYRWKPLQQEAFIKLLNLVATDNTRSTRERVRAIRTIAQIPACKSEVVQSFLSDNDVNIVEAALSAFTWMDRPSLAIPILLQYLDGERARVAMYSIPRAIRFVNRKHLSEILLPALDRPNLKITASKEITRLIGDFRLDPDLKILEAKWSQPKQHRDIKIAILHAIQNLLDNPKAWNLVEEAAHSPDPDIAMALLSAKVKGWSSENRHRYVKILVGLTKHADMQVRKSAYLSLPNWSEGVENVLAEASKECILHLEEGVEWKEAALGLIYVCQDGAAPNFIVETLAGLAERSQEISRSSQRDMPARQRLFSLIHSLSELPHSKCVALGAIFRQIETILENHFGLEQEIASLKIARLALKNIEEVVSSLRVLAKQSAQSPFHLASLPELIQKWLTRSYTACEPFFIAEVARQLAEEDAFESQFIALPILDIATQRLSWNKDCISILQKLRTSQHPVVRERALRMFYWNE